MQYRVVCMYIYIYTQTTATAAAAARTSRRALVCGIFHFTSGSQRPWRVVIFIAQLTRRAAALRRRLRFPLSLPIHTTTSSLSLSHSVRCLYMYNYIYIYMCVHVSRIIHTIYHYAAALSYHSRVFMFSLKRPILSLSHRL